MDEVVQIDSVFNNVSKGIQAKTQDLKRCFGTDDTSAIVKLILEKGEVQVSEKERKVDMERTVKDVASIIHTKCINTQTQRPFPIDVIEDALKEIHFSVKQGKSAKQQALQTIPDLQRILPITRCEMRLQVLTQSKIGKTLKKELQPLFNAIEKEDWSADWTCEVRIDPGNFRAIEDLVKQGTRGQGAVDILDLAVQDDGDLKME